MEKIARSYFAYGSNMNLVQMKQRCSSPKVLSIARLPGYRVEFYGYSALWDGAQETLVPDLESEVWGVLYELEFYDCESLDTVQDARVNGMGAYFHYPVKVINLKHETIEALIYKKDVLRDSKLPSTEYLEFIVQGAKEQGLPAEYITILNNKKSKPAAYAVPMMKNSNLIKMSVSTDCNDCG